VVKVLELMLEHLEATDEVRVLQKGRKRRVGELGTDISFP
jgi:hypothetical protein